MDYKTKRTVLSSAVMISSFIVCLVCVIVLINAMTPTVNELPGNTETPVSTTPAVTLTTPPVETTPPATSNATPTQTYHNSPYTTAPQTTNTPQVTISVTSEPPAPTPTDVLDNAELLAFDTKLVGFTETGATYAVTMTFNATGTVRMVAVNSDRMLTTTDITPNFIRNLVSGMNLDVLSTPTSYTSGVSTANTSMTLTITTGLKPVDFFIIIDTDVENGLMSESIVRKNHGYNIPTIANCTAPSVDAEGYLTFDVTLTQDATIYVQIGEDSQGTLVETTTAGKASFITEYKEEYAGASLIAYVQYEGVNSTYKTVLGTIPTQESSETVT